jgi:hypothetical protein
LLQHYLKSDRIEQSPRVAKEHILHTFGAALRLTAINEYRSSADNHHSIRRLQNAGA